MSRIFGIDPGSTESGFTIIDENYKVIDSQKADNDYLIELLMVEPRDTIIVIESIQSYGVTMGKSIIETCYFIGRIIQVCSDTMKDYHLIPRPEYGKSIVAGNKVNDSLIRAALEMRFGSYDKGRVEKKLKSGVIKQAGVEPGPLHKLSGSTDQRSAFAVACYYLDKGKQ